MLIVASRFLFLLRFVTQYCLLFLLGLLPSVRPFYSLIQIRFNYCYTVLNKRLSSLISIQSYIAMDTYTPLNSLSHTHTHRNTTISPINKVADWQLAEKLTDLLVNWLNNSLSHCLREQMVRSTLTKLTTKTHSSSYIEPEQCVLKLWRRICLQLNELRVEVVRRKSKNKFVSFLVLFYFN
jgi:hypothetical protein